MGKPTSGKSTSIMNLKDDPTVAYLNTDLKEVPFKTNPDGMKIVDVLDPKDVLTFIDSIENNEKVHTVILDTVTFLMNSFERQYITASHIVDTRAAWGSYSTFYGDIMDKIKKGTKTYIILAHEEEIYNETAMAIESKVPLKGAVGRIGVEGDFTTILAAKRLDTTTLKKYTNDLLTYNDREEALKVKYVFQTQITADTIHHKMRSHMDLWTVDETYINNDIKLVIDRLNDYYGNS